MKYVFELCAGRHSTPASASLFSNEVNPLDVDGLYSIANSVIAEDATCIELYVTGLSVALLAAVKVCNDRHIDLIANHYDLSSATYYPQQVLKFDECPFCHSRIRTDAWYCPNCGSN